MAIFPNWSPYNKTGNRIMPKDINHPLVETKRPAMYAAMKYWGKKPHNIWREYINTYTPKDGTVMDPFAGSAVSAFEAVKAGRKAVVFDINPLTSFLIEAYCCEFNEPEFVKSVNHIVEQVEKDSVYNNVFSTHCKFCDAPSADVIQNCKWENGAIYEVGVQPTCPQCFIYSKYKKYLRKPVDSDVEKADMLDANEFRDEPLDRHWTPSKEFPNSPSFSANFIESVGGRRFLNLWTGRNLYVLSKIFHLIEQYPEGNLKKHLLFGFIQAVHLCSKMCVPRRLSAKRPFSTSWGRSAYICTSRQMEMNPLLLFRRNCLDTKQSVRSSLRKVTEHIGKIPKIMRVDDSNRSSVSGNYDIKYGAIDAVSLSDKYVTPKDQVKFMITDPPYGGLIQYMDLSSIWLVWLERHNDRFSPNYDCEITIKPGIQELDVYKRRMTKTFENMVALLPNDGKIIFTFHNSDLSIWNAFLHALFDAGLKVEKVIHQPNRRTGETNVANPYSTSANDFYIRCTKSLTKPTKKLVPVSRIENMMVREAIKIIAMRNEPTPYHILAAGILPEIFTSGFYADDFNGTIDSMLRKHIGTEFVTSGKHPKGAGDFWWLKNPQARIKNPELPLSDRVRLSVLNLLRRDIAIKLDDALAEVYVNYPNGLTPDRYSVLFYLKIYATRSGGRWVYKGDANHDTGISEHTKVLEMLAKIGKKLNNFIRVGKREMSEKCPSGKMLSDYNDKFDLQGKLNLSDATLKRIEQIDMLWVGKKSVNYAIEVENTTSFVKGIHRASNLGVAVPKIMAIPDARLSELKQALNDKLTRENFADQNWRYIKYSNVVRLSSRQHVSLSLWESLLGDLSDIEES